MVIKVLLSLLLITIIGLNYIRYGKQPEPFEQGTYSYQLWQKGPYPVIIEDVELVDHSRSTPASGNYPELDSRQLLIRIWRPEHSEPAAAASPLLIYNHGFLSSRVDGSYLARHLASYGYVVAAAGFPLTKMESRGPQRGMDVLNHPGDVSFIIDRLLLRNEAVDDPLHGAIDSDRIATAGMSLGGMTASLLAYHPTMGDPRIAAAISIAGPSYLFLEAFYRDRDIPFLMIASPIDAVIDYQANALPIPERIRRSVLVTLNGASHVGFSFQARALRWMHNPDRIGCWVITNKRADETPWLHRVGTLEQGILQQVVGEICTRGSFPTAMNPIAQQRLTMLAATSFLQSLFARDAAQRERHWQFLAQHFPAENDAVSVTVSAALLPPQTAPVPIANGRQPEP